MSKALKRFVLRFGFGIECVVFIWFLAKSLNSIYGMQSDNRKLELEIASLNKIVCGKQSQIEQWNSDSFYREQIARENLQMANAKDEIYYV